MRHRSRPKIDATSRTTVAQRGHRSERGDTLVEVLISLVVLGTASVALLIAFSTSIAASGEHRNLATDNTVLATASQEVMAAINNEPQLFTNACSNDISQYPFYGSAGVTLPSPYDTPKYTGYVQYVNTPTASTTTSLPAVQYWNGSTFQSTCENSEPQLITIGISGTSYTNSFVVQYPIVSTNGNTSDPASKLIFLVQPAGGYAGSPFTTQPVVEISNGSSAVSTDLSPVTLTLTTGTGVLAGCQGNEILGVVTFSGCTLGTGGEGFRITATDGNLKPAVSKRFDVTSSDFYLRFSTQPVAGHSGSPFTTPPVVTVYNTADNSIDWAWSGKVTLTSSGGLLTNCPGSTNMSDTLDVVNGVATFPSTCDFSGGYFYNPNSSPQVTATQYTMTATANPNAGTDAAVPALSQSFSVSSFGPASQLAFTTEPTGVASISPTTTFSGQPAVTVEDAFGNVVTSASNTISLKMFQGSTSETLSNCTSSFNEGTAAFAGCNGAAYNTGLDLVATGTGLTSATSTNFNITGVVSQLLFTTSPVAGASGSAFSIQPDLVFEDSSNRVVTSTTSVVTFTVTPASGSLSTCTGLAPNLGNVNVQNCVFTGLVGTSYTLTGTAGGLASAPSTAFSPTSPGVATQLVFTTQPVAGAAGAALTTQPVVKIEDVAGNVITSSTASINLAASGGTLANCTGLTAAAGVVNVSNCTFGGTVGMSYTVTATSGTLKSATSNNFSPSGPGILNQILLSGCPSSMTVTTTCTITATLEDAFGNLETMDNSSAVTFSSLTGAGSLTGFTSTTASSGQALDILTAASAGSVTFDASDASVTSNVYAITVNAAPSITTSSLAAATQGETGYSQTLAGTNGTTPYTWSITSGALPTGLSLNTATGAITGTVGGSASSQTFSATLTDSDGVTATTSLAITVNAAPSIAPNSLPGATRTSTYSQTLTVAGGTTPFGAWSITSGSLPTGLSLNTATGAITGTVNNTATSQTFTVQTTDANGVAATNTYTITVSAPPIITTSSLATATEGQIGYSQTLAATGGTAPYTWSITTGTLPAGLSLNGATAAITGTVGGSATSQSVTFTVTDTNSVAITKTLLIAVNAPPSITTSTLPSATQTGTYNQTIFESGGTAPFTWSVTTGVLPSGLSINSATGATTGTVSGTAASEIFTVTLTDVNNVSTTNSLTITVNAAPSITTTSLATATQNETGYSQTLAGTSGTTPYTWSVTTGTLPTGLSLNGATGAITGTVSGSATSQTFNVTLADTNLATATNSFTITVNAAPSITTSSLSGGTTGSAYNQTVAATGGTAPYAWSISSGILPAGLSLDAAAGTITGTVSGSAVSETFTIKDTDANGVTATMSLSISIS